MFRFPWRSAHGSLVARSACAWLNMVRVAPVHRSITDVCMLLAMLVWGQGGGPSWRGALPLRHSLSTRVFSSSLAYTLGAHVARWWTVATGRRM
eukprot:888873-Pyramimonas_sp.AAC.1